VLLEDCRLTAVVGALFRLAEGRPSKASLKDALLVRRGVVVEEESW